MTSYVLSYQKYAASMQFITLQSPMRTCLKRSEDVEVQKPKLIKKGFEKRYPTSFFFGGIAMTAFLTSTFTNINMNINKKITVPMHKCINIKIN